MGRDVSIHEIMVFYLICANCSLAQNKWRHIGLSLQLIGFVVCLCNGEIEQSGDSKF